MGDPEEILHVVRGQDVRDADRNQRATITDGHFHFARHLRRAVGCVAENHHYGVAILDRCDDPRAPLCAGAKVARCDPARLPRLLEGCANLLGLDLVRRGIADENLGHTRRLISAAYRTRAV